MAKIGTIYEIFSSYFRNHMCSVERTTFMQRKYEGTQSRQHKFVTFCCGLLHLFNGMFGVDMSRMHNFTVFYTRVFGRCQNLSCFVGRIVSSDCTSAHKTRDI